MRKKNSCFRPFSVCLKLWTLRFGNKRVAAKMPGERGKVVFALCLKKEKGEVC